MALFVCRLRFFARVSSMARPTTLVRKATKSSKVILRLAFLVSANAFLSHPPSMGVDTKRFFVVVVRISGRGLLNETASLAASVCLESAFWPSYS